MTSGSSGSNPYGMGCNPIKRHTSHHQNSYHSNRFVVADAILKPKLQYFQFQPVAVGAAPILNAPMAAHPHHSYMGPQQGNFSMMEQTVYQPPSTEVAPMPNPLIAGAGTMVPLDLLKNRQPARVISIMDAIFATVLLVFHGLTLMVQEMPENENRSEDQNWLLPPIPMTPGELNITGYMEVIAWIGILSVNFLQLLVAVSLFNASDKQCESLKAFEASRVWLKTCIFLVIILMIKLCILYFMYEMDMKAYGTIVFTTLETIFHGVGAVFILKFFNEIKRNNPIASRIYYQSEDSSSPKRNNVADAVWF